MIRYLSKHSEPPGQCEHLYFWGCSRQGSLRRELGLRGLPTITLELRKQPPCHRPTRAQHDPRAITCHQDGVLCPGERTFFHNQTHIMPSIVWKIPSAWLSAAGLTMCPISCPTLSWETYFPSQTLERSWEWGRDRETERELFFPRGSFGKGKNSLEKPQRKLCFCQDSAPSTCHVSGQFIWSYPHVVPFIQGTKSTQLLQHPSLPHLLLASVLFPYCLTSPGEPCIWCGKLWVEGIFQQNYQVDRGDADQNKWSHLVFTELLLHSWHHWFHSVLIIPWEWPFTPIWWWGNWVIGAWSTSPRLCSEQGLTSQLLMPGAITQEPAGDSRADVIALQEASSHCEGSEMIPLRMLITSVVFLDIHSVTFWAVLYQKPILKQKMVTWVTVTYMPFLGPPYQAV